MPPMKNGRSININKSNTKYSLSSRMNSSTSRADKTENSTKATLMMTQLENATMQMEKQKEKKKEKKRKHKKEESGEEEEDAPDPRGGPARKLPDTQVTEIDTPREPGQARPCLHADTRYPIHSSNMSITACLCCTGCLCVYLCVCVAVRNTALLQWKHDTKQMPNQIH